jgi:hypothetical protein
MSKTSFIAELKRRNVIRMAGLYLAAVLEPIEGDNAP